MPDMTGLRLGRQREYVYVFRKARQLGALLHAVASENLKLGRMARSGEMYR